MQPGNFDDILQVRKIFERRITFRTLPTTLFQIVCEIIFNFQIIVISIKDPNNHCIINP